MSEQKWPWIGDTACIFPGKDTDNFWCSNRPKLGSIRSESRWLGWWYCFKKFGTRWFGGIFTYSKQVSLVKWRLLLWTECTNYNHLHLLVGSVFIEFFLLSCMHKSFQKLDFRDEPIWTFHCDIMLPPHMIICQLVNHIGILSLCSCCSFEILYNVTPFLKLNNIGFVSGEREKKS